MVSLLVLSACNPSKRIARIAERYNLTYLDTITLYDTTIIQGFDTCYIALKSDTINIHDTINNIDYQIIERNDTVYLHVIQKPDTITEIKYVPTQKIVLQKDKKSDIMKLVFAFLFTVGFIAITVYYINQIKSDKQ